MTDRFHSLTVVLGHDMREDDAESLMDAIRHMKGVIRVAGDVTSSDEYVAEMRVKTELSMKLWDVLK